MNLEKAHTQDVIGIRQVSKMGTRWMYFASLTKIIRDVRLQSTISVSFWAFSQW